MVERRQCSSSVKYVDNLLAGRIFVLLVKLACCLEADTIEQTEQLSAPTSLFFFFQHFSKRQDGCCTILMALFVDSLSSFYPCRIFLRKFQKYIYIYIPSLHVDDRIKFSFSLNYEKIIISYLIERFNWKLLFIRTKFNKIKIHSIKSFSICLHEFLASCLHNISKHLI